MCTCVCVCVCVCEREIVKHKMLLAAVFFSLQNGVCVCVCVCEREGERVWFGLRAPDKQEGNLVWH